MKLKKLNYYEPCPYCGGKIKSIPSDPNLGIYCPRCLIEYSEFWQWDNSLKKEVYFYCWYFMKENKEYKVRDYEYAYLK